MTDDELIQELSNRFAQSRKAFSDLSMVNRKLLEVNGKLERSESLKSNFLSNIRNEINNPLNAIIGLASQLAAIGEGNEEIAFLSTLISAEASNLDFQLRNIFMAAELEAGEVDPRCIKIDIRCALRELVDSFLHSAAKKGVSLILIQSANNHVSTVAIDLMKFQIVVSNLLANAIEYSVYGSSVEILFSVGGDGCLRVSVQDHGVGIAAEDQQRIYDRFVQLETGTTRSHRGHGLGLSIVKALLDLMQGNISLESAPGYGTLFTIVLPPCSMQEDVDSFSESGNLFLFDDLNEA